MRFNSKRKSLLLISICGTTLFFTALSACADNVWYGEDYSSDDWTASNPGNWGNGGPPGTGSGVDIFFQDQQRRDYSNFNYGGDSYFRSIVFNSNLPRFMKLYTSNSSTMDLFGSIVSNSYHGVEFDVKVYFRTNDSHIEANNSNLDFYADVDLNNQTIHFLSSGGKDIYMHNAITSGAGGGSIVLDSSYMNVHLYNSGNSYSGQTTINYGTLYNEADNVIPDASALYIGSSGIYNKNGKTEQVASIAGSGSIVLGSSGTLTYGGNASQTYSGTFNGSAGVTKSGSGNWTLTGNSSSTYSGTTTVTAGTLFVNNSAGSATGSGAVAINGGTLGGSGTAAGSVTVSSGANLAPGATASSTAILRTGALTLQSGSNYYVDITGAGGTGNAGSTYDQVSVTGTVNITGSNLIVSASNLTSANIGQIFYIALNDDTDPVTGAFAQGAAVTSGGDVFTINYLANGDSGLIGNDISLTLTAVPEPSTWIAGILAVAALGYSQRRHFLRWLKFG